jgi:hypothetical protein
MGADEVAEPTGSNEDAGMVPLPPPEAVGAALERLLRIDEGRSAIEAAFQIEARVARALGRLDLTEVSDERVVALTYGAEGDPKVADTVYARWYVLQPPDPRYAKLDLVEFLFEQPDRVALHFTAVLMRAVATGRGLRATLPEWREHAAYCRLVPRLLEEYRRRLEKRPVDMAVLSIASIAEVDQHAQAFATITREMAQALPLKPPPPWELSDVLNDELMQLVQSAQANPPGAAQLKALRGWFGAALFTATRQGLLNLYRHESVRDRRSRGGTPTIGIGHRRRPAAPQLSGQGTRGKLTPVGSSHLPAS